MSSRIRDYYYCDFIKGFHNHRLRNKDKLIPLIDKLSKILIYVPDNDRVIIKHDKDSYSIQYYDYALNSFKQFWCLIKGIKYTLKELFIEHQTKFIGSLPDGYKDHNAQEDYDKMSDEELNLKAKFSIKDEWDYYLKMILLEGGYNIEPNIENKGNTKVITSYNITKL